MAITADTGSQLALPAHGGERQSRLIRKLGFAAVILALISGVATFLVLTGQTPIVPTRSVTAAALLGNLLFVLLLLGFIGLEVYRLLEARRRGKAAARLHVRIVALFSIVAVVPALVVAAFASITLSQGLDRWFAERTQAIVQNSLTVARAYMRDNSQEIRRDVVLMAQNLERIGALFEQDRTAYANQLTAQSGLFSLPQVAVVGTDGEPVVQARSPSNLPFVQLSDEALERAKGGEAVVFVIASAVTNRVATLVRLKSPEDHFLYATRPIEPRVLEHVRRTEEGVAEYRDLQSGRFGLQIAFGLSYLSIALIVLVSAIWVGFAFANHFVAPIRRLIGAADEVSRGNFNIALPVKKSQGDLANLAQTFNTMSSELREQRQELLNANHVIDRRARFTEAVLSGVTAGVIGVDQRGLVTLANRSAEQLLGLPQAELLGRPLLDLIPGLSGLMEAALNGRQRLAQGQIALYRGSEERVVSVRVTGEQSDAPQHGFVVTLDDITDLVTAQRTSAWADVARRIAHEIKNPLTPIQLSAERLKRKYGRVITTDREIFEQCTDTIIRQVGDIGRMVDEFASFTRMPKPVLEAEDAAEVVRQAVFLQQVANPEIAFETSYPSGPVMACFDRRLISQAVTNIVKNATEAIAALPEEMRDQPTISVSLRREAGTLVIEVADSGIGLPSENRQKLLEPYITTREAGTGLGLAIVRKIMEDHGGRIELTDGPELPSGRRGALVRLVMPLRLDPPSDTTPRSSRVGQKTAAEPVG